MGLGGGYLDLLPGTTWDEPISHCSGPTSHTEYADISTACSSQRFYFRCQCSGIPCEVRDFAGFFGPGVFS